MNDITLYFAVLTLFEQNFSGCGRFRKMILVGSTLSAAPAVVTEAAPSSALPVEKKNTEWKFSRMPEKKLGNDELADKYDKRRVVSC